MTKPKKERLDKLLVDAGLCATRSQAQGMILAGKVRMGSQVLDKAGTLMAPDQVEALTLAETLPFVSRGGLKLAKALMVFEVDPTGRVCLDVGASTGGFTDCLLQRGAAKVYAIDVGTHQLDWRLRQDPRVVSLEQTNIRGLTRDGLGSAASGEAITLAVTDVSFISLTKAVPCIAQLLSAAPGAEIIALIKPQFEYKDVQEQLGEAGPLSLKGFDGVVRDPAAHQVIVETTIRSLLDLLQAESPADDSMWYWAGLTVSPITGPKGNREFPVWFRRAKAADSAGLPLSQLGDVVAQVLADCDQPVTAN